ncbi:hypothetical protein C2G38_2169929 [Gigaspora rosea]|uniref:Uncharacterized protein n=1 Tax=Gigaspora rosea TaxID=44941 RepID=A0A397VQ89_9GLOM|nr:hypothetical protein C2G38_2169929 [Gigaspora rosea]
MAASLSLDSYYLYASHDMQILSTNQFYECLNNPVAQVNPIIELNETRQLLEIAHLENQQKLELIMDLNNQISWMQQYIKDQKNKREELKSQL